MYFLIRFFLFTLNAEDAHHLTLSWGNFFIKIPGVKYILRSFYCNEDSKLEKNIAGLRFKNKVGLAAGLDKNAECMELFECLGFGSVEIGTVTPMPQPGNEKPRLFRLINDEAIINRMGFNNVGMDVVKVRLKHFREKFDRQKSQFRIGVNIGKNKNTPNENAVDDYIKCFTRLYDEADYFVVNVSSPNTPGLRELQEKPALEKILHALQQIALPKETKRPVFLKISPDLSREQLDDVIDLTIETKIAGLIATNTTITRENLQATKEKIEAIGNGGLSGKPLKQKADAVLQYIAKKANGRFAIIGVGGIHTAKDAKEKTAAGADLIQLYTGFIYKGPSLIKQILKATP